MTKWSQNMQSESTERQNSWVKFYKRVYDSYTDHIKLKSDKYQIIFHVHIPSKYMSKEFTLLF